LLDSWLFFTPPTHPHGGWGYCVSSLHSSLKILPASLISLTNP
jgi:hypothetical protein